MPLLEIEQMPLVAGLSVPGQFYAVLREPALLAGMALPGRTTPWDRLHDAGFRHVVCLTGSPAHYDPHPLKMLHATFLQDLVGGNDPDDPAGEAKLIQSAVTAALGRLAAKEGVAVHCMGGTGRTGTVLGCTLLPLGYRGPDIVAYLHRLNQARGRHGWPEAPWQAAQVLAFPASGEPCCVNLTAPN